MVIFARTNDKLYNMTIIQKYEKLDDDKIIFTYYTGQQHIEVYDSQNKRDTAYNNLESEFTKNIDG